MQECFQTIWHLVIAAGIACVPRNSFTFCWTLLLHTSRLIVSSLTVEHHSMFWLHQEHPCEKVFSGDVPWIRWEGLDLDVDLSAAFSEVSNASASLMLLYFLKERRLWNRSWSLSQAYPIFLFFCLWWQGCIRAVKVREGLKVIYYVSGRSEVDLGG